VNVPNILTVFRLLAALAVGLVFAYLPSPYAEWVALTLFVAAALTDYLDGYLARKWDQITNIGRMLDPIADKAMVLVALLVIAVRMPYLGTGMDVLVPIILITFREVFVSGLREFLGEKAGRLKVTWLAKWKTTVQMLAIVVLFASFLLGHYYQALSWSLSNADLLAIREGDMEDEEDILWVMIAYDWGTIIGVWLLWLAATLTVITGLDYFRKAVPVLRDVK